MAKRSAAMLIITRSMPALDFVELGHATWPGPRAPAFLAWPRRLFWSSVRALRGVQRCTSRERKRAVRSITSL
jgi:hypothetical protein